MTTNTPSALSLFPNEVLDEVLGQLVDSFPLPTGYDPDPPKRSPALLALQSIVLVSRQWHGLAQPKIVSKIVVRSGTRARKVAAGLAHAGLGIHVKEVQLHGRPSLSTDVPTDSDLAQDDGIAPEDVVALLELVPRLAVLELRFLRFVRFRQRNILLLSVLPCLANVHTLLILSAPFDATLELLTTVLPLFPALRTLKHRYNYIVQNFRPRLTSEHPFLETLALAGPSSVSAWFALVPNVACVTSLFLGDLGDYQADFGRLVNFLGPRLRTLQVMTPERHVTELVNYLPNCTSLHTLGLHFIADPSTIITIFSNIPTVHTFETEGDRFSVTNLLAALAATWKPAALMRLRLVDDAPGMGTEIAQLEAYGLEVTMVGRSWMGLA